MGHRFADLAFTPAVKAVQDRLGSRDGYERLEEGGEPHHDRLTEAEAAFLAERDSLYMASVSETGWPYVQHRGGPKGFVRVLDQRTIGFADFRGNRQYVSVGNLGQDDRVALILVDYPNRRRLKILGHARLVEAAHEPATLARLELPGYRARVERGILITVAALDWNCPQHLTPRFTLPEIEAATAPLRTRIAELEAALAAAARPDPVAAG
jgi:predicted pyridoxine 5'-phosphate oxidase superfamily flavin-nucleotide-binding protein